MDGDWAGGENDEMNASFSERFQRLAAGTSAGFVVGIITIFFNVSVAALIFKGTLAPYLAEGISLVFWGNVVLLLMTALNSSVPGMVCAIQEVPVGILAVVAIDIAYSMSGATDEQIYATVLGAIVSSTLLTALTFWVLGYLRWGQFVRFIPYPVIGGFLAGTGWLLLVGAIQVMADVAIQPALVDPIFWARWFPGLLVGLLIFFALRRSSHFLVMPVLVVGAVALFYLSLLLLGVTPDRALADGWLLGPFPSSDIWQPATVLDLRAGNWSVIFREHGASLLAIPLVSSFALLLNISALEVAMEQDSDVSQELHATGIANGLAALFGSPPGFVTVSDSMLGKRLGGGGWLLSVVIAGVLVATLIAGTTALAYIPRLVVGAMLVFLGLLFLVDWLYDTWFRLSRVDYLLIVLITVTIAFFGFLQGVVLGILVAVVLFVINYSRIDALRHFYSRADYPSYVSRPPTHEQQLQSVGGQILIAELQGYLFFGTAYHLFKQVRTRIEQRDINQVHFVLLDFRLVTGIDSSVTSSFQRFLRYLEESQVTLVLTHLAPNLRRLWLRQLSVVSEDGDPSLFPTLDQGLAWCEEQLLSRGSHSELSSAETTHDKSSTHETPRTPSARSAFFAMVHDLLTTSDAIATMPDLAPLQSKMSRLDVDTDEILVTADEPLDGIFYVEEGEVAAQTMGSNDDVIILRRMQKGAIFGEISLYTEGRASADVVARRPSILYHLSRSALTELETDEPPLAIAIHHLVARDLSRKLIQSTRALSVFKQ